MAHGGHRPVTRHQRAYSSRDTHTSGGFDPTAPTDPNYGSQLDGAQIGAWQIPPGSINDGNVDPGGLDGDGSITPGSLGLTPFASSIRPVAVINAVTGELLLLEDGDYVLLEDGYAVILEQSASGDALPALPDDDYPIGSLVYNMYDNKIYRNIANSWSKEVDGNDLIAGSVVAGKIAAGAISTSELAAEAVTTEKLAVTAEIRFVSNNGATAVIDDDGLAITDGAITVTNGDDVVIIDGTSDMFKIAATGTLSRSQGNNTNGSSAITLSGLGAWAYMPAHLCLLGGESTNQYAGGIQLIEHAISSSAPLDVYAFATGRATLDGSDQAVVTLQLWNYDTGVTYETFMRYYVLIEAGI